MEEITCPFCATSGDEALQEDGWTARRCPQCRLVFLSPRPLPADTEKLYVEDAAHWPASTHLMDYGSPDNRLETRRTLRLLRRHQPSGRLLELGPGSGALLATARAHGYDVSGVELNPEQVAFIRDVLDVPCAASLAEVAGTFDVVYHRDVLSHFSDPVEVFGEIHDRLNPGGFHIFETGNGDFHRRYERFFSTYQFPDHLFFFSERSIALLLERTGFDHVATHRYALAPFLAAQRAQDRLRAVRGDGAAPAGADRVPATEAARGIAPESRSDQPAPGERPTSAVALVKYALRYGAGAVAPKDNRPYTMIVVARKAA